MYYWAFSKISIKIQPKTFIDRNLDEQWYVCQSYQNWVCGKKVKIEGYKYFLYAFTSKLLPSSTVYCAECNIYDIVFK